MNKKILAISILAVFMLVAITIASAINTTNTNKKESPLFGIRTKLATGERLQYLKETVKARFVGDRLFFLPFNFLLKNSELSASQQLQVKAITIILDNCNPTSTYTACVPTGRCCPR